MELRGKNVVVTGGSQGIGEQIARQFAARDANVMVVARSGDKLAKVASDIGGHHLVADLTNSTDLDGLVDACIAELGSIDVFVNNAGVETNDAFVNLTTEQLRVLARLNFEAPVILTRFAARHMLENGGGHIVQLSSVAGVTPFPGLAAYAGSKAGLTNFTETLRLELAKTDVNFTVVAPGPVDTDMWDRQDFEGSYMAPALKRFRRMLFLPKVSPEKIAKATVNAVQKNKRFVRIPARYGPYHAMNNAPRRIVEASLTGVKLTPKLENDRP